MCQNGLSNNFENEFLLDTLNICDKKQFRGHTILQTSLVFTILHCLCLSFSAIINKLYYGTDHYSCKGNTFVIYQFHIVIYQFHFIAFLQFLFLIHVYHFHFVVYPFHFLLCPPSKKRGFSHVGRSISNCLKNNFPKWISSSYICATYFELTYPVLQNICATKNFRGNNVLPTSLV